MHYYVKYDIENGDYRIKHFDEEEMQNIRGFIRQQESNGCTNFCVKCSNAPMASLLNLPGIMPYLNVADEEQFNNLDVDITDEFMERE